MNKAYIVAAKRTPVASRNGALAHYPVIELGARVIDAAIQQAGLSAGQVDSVIMGNALYAGGNPARLAALSAGIPACAAAMTIDTQCCSGLDAINTACQMVQSGAAHVVVAGGLESYSRAPIRQTRPLNKHDTPITYQRPPFTPWPARDPDMLDAAAGLARQRRISRQAQECFAVDSHAKARRVGAREGELVAFDELSADSFTRNLNEKVCARAPVIRGDTLSGLTPTTVAVEADAAAVVVVVSESMLPQIRGVVRPVSALPGFSVGADPEMPSLAPIAAVEKVLLQQMVAPDELVAVEVMEAFAVQAMVCIDACGFDRAVVNRGGGALARGHPVGASGAVLAVRLWWELQREAVGGYGLATIAAAGGLGSALLWRVV